jgi:hypothetical protein
VQCNNCGAVTGIAGVFFGTKRRNRRLGSINETRDREEHVVSVLWTAPSGLPAERVHFENQQRPGVRNRNFAGLLCSVKIASTNCHHAAAGKRAVHAENNTRDYIVHNA